MRPDPQDWDLRYAWAASEREAERAEAIIREEAQKPDDDDPCPRCGGDHDRIDRREPCPPSEALKPCGCYVDDIDCPAEHRVYNEKQDPLYGEQNVIRHENAGCTLTRLEYDPDYGADQWRCTHHGIVVTVPGWRAL
jgi:hypothetical protein